MEKPKSRPALPNVEALVDLHPKLACGARRILISIRSTPSLCVITDADTGEQLTGIRRFSVTCDAEELTSITIEAYPGL